MSSFNLFNIETLRPNVTATQAGFLEYLLALKLGCTIADAEDSIACLLAIECEKFEKAVELGDTLEDLIALDSSVAGFIERICCLESALATKLATVATILNDCE